MRFLAAFFTAVMIMIGSVAQAAMVARDGDLFFRYRGGPAAGSNTSVVTPFDADVTARFIGVVGYDFSEKIPLIPGKIVKRWSILDGDLPNGLTFDTAVGVFEGMPVDERLNQEVYLQGYDAAGKANAIAHVIFDVFKPRDQFGVVDFYGHTGKYRFEQLPVPARMTVDRWKVHYAPPPGVKVIGRNYDGTPTKAGRYPVVVQGFDYMNREIILLAGYYLVQDGPTFPEVADDVRPINPEIGRQLFDLWRPAVRTVAPGNDYTQMMFEVELAPGEELPGTVFAQDFIGRLVGEVFYPYQTAKVRWKATDIDGTVGFSNWFTFGTSYPSPRIGDGQIGPFDGVVGEEFKLVFNEQGTAGDKTFSLIAGELPEGLELDTATGVISGIPVKAEVQSGIVVKLEVENAGNVDVTQTKPFEIRIDDQKVGVQISLAPTAARSARLTTLSAAPPTTNIATATTMKRLYVRTSSNVALKITPVGAVFDPVNIDIDPNYPLPDGLGFNKTTNIISGSLSDEWKGKVRVTLLNGNGKTAEGVLDVGAFHPLAVEDLGDVFVTQYENVDPPIPVKISGIMPNQAGMTVPKVELVGQVPSGISYSFLTKGLVGGTTDPAGTYGPVTVRVTDGSGETVESTPFMINVQPRKGLAIDVADVEMKLSESKVSPVLRVIRPPLTGNMDLTFSLVAGSLPQGLSVNPSNGDIEGQATAVATHKDLRIRVSDDEGYSAVSAPFTLSVTPAADLFPVSGSLVRVPVSYPATLEPLPFIGAVGTLDYISAVGLPDGLAMTSDGVISGMPTEVVERKQVSITARDGAGREATGVLYITVVPKPTISFEGGVTTLNVAQYETKAFNLVQKDFIGSAEISIIKGTLPPGFKMSPLGRLSGTSMEKGTWDKIVVRATDTATQLSADLTFKIVIGDRKPTEISYPDPATVYPGTQANLPLRPTVNNARYPVTFTFLGGKLPTGISFRTEDGTFVGSPTEIGRFNDIFVSATDSENVSAIARFSMLSTKMGGISAAPLTEYRYRAGETFTTPQKSFDNFVAPATFSVMEQSGPSLSFDQATGTFSGMIPAPATFAAKLTMVDDHGRKPMLAARVIIEALPPVAVLSQPSNVEIYQYAKDPTPVVATFDNVIGTARYSLAGTLPAGLVFDTVTGAISGRASTAGTFSNLRISVTDSHDGSTATTAPFTIKVLPRKPLIATLPATATTLVNRPISQIAVVDVKNPAYGTRPQYSVSGVLPAGITLQMIGDAAVFQGTARELGDFPGIYVTVTDAVGASATAGPLTIRSALNGDPIYLSGQDIVTHVGWSFSTPVPIVDNEVGKIRFYSYDMAPEINLDPLTGVMSGTFKIPYDLEFDLYVGDETARVTSDRLKVVAVPDIRAVYPTLIQTQQYLQMTRIYPDVSYEIGQVTFAKANPGDWPAGINLDPTTGAIYGIPKNAKTVTGLQVEVTDTNGRDTMTKLSNPFSIATTMSAAKPFLEPIPPSFLSTADIGSVNVTPIVRDTISGGGWPYGGLTFSLEGTLPRGLSFDPATGTIFGTPKEATAYRDFSITVTDTNGYSAKSNVFKIGVKPYPPMSLARTAPEFLEKRPGQQFEISAPTVLGAIGKVTFQLGAGTSAGLSAQVDAETGSIRVSATAPSTVVIEATDEMGQKAAIGYYIGMRPVVTASAQPFSVMQGYDFQLGVPPTVSNADGATTFEWKNLPAGLTFDPTTGVVSGTATAAPGTYTAKLVVTDATSAGPETDVTVIVLDPTPHKYWRITGWPGFYRGAVGLVQFIHPNGENLSLKVNTGEATATSSGLEGAPAEKPEWIFDGVNAVRLLQDPVLGVAWGALEFDEPVTVYRMRYSSCPGQIMFWSGQLSYSDDGQNWTTVSPAFEGWGGCLKEVVRNK